MIHHHHRGGPSGRPDDPHRVSMRMVPPVKGQALTKSQYEEWGTDYDPTQYDPRMKWDAGGGAGDPYVGGLRSREDEPLGEETFNPTWMINQQLKYGTSRLPITRSHLARRSNDE